MELKIDKSNWKKVKLGDVAFEYSKRINNPNESEFDRFVGSSNIGQWDFRVKSWKPTDSVTSAMKLFEPNDYLLVRRSLYASDFRERAPRAHFSGVCSGDILTIKENPEKVVDGFLIGIFNSPALWKYVVANASGSITRRIKWKDLANYEFLLPPKEQQAKLAELLWAMDEVIEKDNFTLDKLNISYASEKKEIYKSKVNKRIILGEHIDILSGFPFKSKLFNKSNVGLPLIRIRNISKSKIETFYSGEYDEKFIIRRGELIVGMDGDFIMNIWKNKNALLNQRIIKISLKEDTTSLLFDYLRHFLQKELDKIHIGIGATTVKHLAISDVRKIKLSIPKNNLNILINRLDLFNKNILNLESKISSSKALQKSLINQVF
jgi:restriction endonuclease S subunit